MYWLGNEFYNLFFISLFQFHNLNSGFDELVRLTRVFLLFPFSNGLFISISLFNIELIKN